MQNIAIVEQYCRARYSFFKWRYSLAFMKKMILALGVACLIGLLAQVKFLLPGTPVPITGQTFAVLLAGVLLGSKWGGVSTAMYILFGMAGVPWFVGFSGGFGVIFGPSGGYIIGFIFAALFLGYFTDKYTKSRNFFSMLVLMLFANFVLIHLPGLLQLGLWVHISNIGELTFWKLLSMGTIPFVFGDIIKIIAAAALATTITPKEAYNK